MDEAYVDRERRGGPSSEDFAIAAALAQPFIVYQMVLRFRHPPGAYAWSRADPILKLLPGEPILWLIPLFGIALMIAWLVVAWPSWLVTKHAAIAAACGVAAAIGAAFLVAKVPAARIRWLALEESGASGAPLTIAAGYLEEILVRIGILPLVYLNQLGRGRPFAIIAGSLVAGAGFALLHEAGPADFSLPLFLARFAGPGVLLCVLALVTKPAFAVVFHCTAHLLLASALRLNL